MSKRQKNGDDVAAVKAKKSGEAGEAAKKADKNDKSAAAMSQEEIDRRNQKLLSIGGFAGLGLLMGFLWGANHMVAQVSDACPLSQAAEVGYLIATNTAAWGRGVLTGIIGAMCGGTFGYSLFLTKKTPAAC